MSKKSRFDGLDVAAMSLLLQRTVIGFKVANIYDGYSGNKGTYLFKLSNTFKSSEDEAGRSVVLLVESGARFHLTNLTGPVGDSSAPPSAFAMKLRKHIRNTRVENVAQLGLFDRVVDIRFGNGPTAHHLILELYGTFLFIFVCFRVEALTTSQSSLTLHITAY